MSNLLVEISQFGFITSIVYILYFIGHFFIKLYGRTKLGKDVQFQPNKGEKVMFLLSFAYLLTYLL